MADIRLRDYLAKIQELVANERHDEAVRHCQHILHQYPKHVATYCLLGEACLEMGRHQEATDLFQRSLSADPENLMARVGLGIIHTLAGESPESIWHMERAYELAPGNPEVRQELERLYEARDGGEKARLQLTRGGLGRLYARNGLYERAIAEFRSVLRENPDSADIRASMAEALWREGRRLEAVETCLDLVQILPNCLKANLILGEIWVRGGHEDAGQEKLQVARALDPENLVAQELMGRESPLPLEDVYILELDIAPEVDEPSPMDPAEKAKVGIAATAALAEVHGAIDEAYAADELPEWLLELPGEEARPEGETDTASAEGPAFLEDVPGWLAALAVKEAVEERPLASESLLEEGLLAEGVPPSPLFGSAAGAAAPVEGYPDWLDELGATDDLPMDVETAVVDLPTATGETLAGETVAAEVPAEQVAVETAETPAQEIAPSDEVPEWVRGLESPYEDESPTGDRPTSEDLLAAAAAPAVGVAAAREEADAPGEDRPPWVRTMEAAVADVATDEGAEPGDEDVPVLVPPAESEVGASPDDAESRRTGEPVETGVEAEDDGQDEAEAQAVEEVAGAPSRLVELQNQIAAQPGNYRARMELARRYRDAQDWDAALAEYEELVSTRKLLPAVIEDLRSLTQEDVDPVQLYKLMGDAYTQADHPDEAQQMYRLARKALGKE